MSSENKIKNKKSLFANVLDILIALSLVTVITLGLKYSYETFFSNYQTTQSLVALDEMLEETIDRSEFNPEQGDLVFKLKIDGLSDWIPVIEGDSLPNLEKGAVHNSLTGYPGDSRQIFTSAHRNTHYKDIDKVTPGSTIIEVKTPYSSETYKYLVDRVEVVNETQVEVVKTGVLDRDELVLMTCYPFTSWSTTNERYLVYAYPVE